MTTTVILPTTFFKLLPITWTIFFVGSYQIFILKRDANIIKSKDKFTLPFAINFKWKFSQMT